MAPSNRWTPGLMYYQGKFNGVPFFTQPGGAFTKVFPTNQNNVVWSSWPGPATMTLNECANWVSPPCEHTVKMYTIIREFDYNTGQSVALLTCPTCSIVARAVEPYEAIFDPNLYAVVVA